MDVRIKFLKDCAKWACNPFTGWPVIEFRKGDILDISESFIANLLEHGMIEIIGNANSDDHATNQNDEPETPIEKQEAKEDVKQVSTDDVDRFRKRLENIVKALKKKDDINKRFEMIAAEIGIKSIDKTLKPEKNIDIMVEKYAEVNNA